MCASCAAWLQAAGGQDPELDLQRRLARKLGLKKGKAKMGGDDGLDELLDGELPWRKLP